jgi:hypothetical protein
LISYIQQQAARLESVVDDRVADNDAGVGISLVQESLSDAFSLIVCQTALF